MFVLKAVCTGSFDPVTNGHINIFERAARIVDELIVCVFINKRKKSFFTVPERIKFLRDSTIHIKNLRVDACDKLVTDYIKEHDINFIIRGIRSTNELEYEMNEANMIKTLSPNIETIFLLTEPKFSFISSSGVRGLIYFNRVIKDLVPECIELALRKKISRENVF